MTDGDTVSYARLRPLVFSIAYRMLGSVAEAEDVVQEALLRIYQSTRDGTPVRSADALATTVTTRLAIDALRSARRRREAYVGPWLPEPLVASADDDPSGRIEMDETLSVAFLTVLERLSALERAVFILREVFAYGYADIAAVLDRSEASCRQLLTRARRHLAEGQPRFDPSPQRCARLSSQFFAALEHGDLAGLERLLAEDAVFYGDGGGKAPAITAPLRGRVPVARFLRGLGRQGARLNVRIDPVLANGQPGARLLTSDGALIGVVSLEIEDGRVAAVHNQINPDKLAHLGRVGDMSALLGQHP